MSGVPLESWPHLHLFPSHWELEDLWGEEAMNWVGLG